MMCKSFPSSNSWPAPAKLNLFLHITGRRRDGYHLLQTVFQLLDYGDTLRFNVRGDGRIHRCSVLSAVKQNDDLAVRAARLLQRVCGDHHGVDIHLTKHLPIGGGLGGGSSDAATTLVALNVLWRCGLSTAELASLGKELGADIPLFIHGYSAWGEGIGEQLQPLELPQQWYLVVKPPVEISTASVFRASELTRNCLPITINDFFSGRGKNVFEPVVRARFPVVDEVLIWLHGRGSRGARLTGTGSCVFTPFASQDAAELLLDELPENWQGFIAQGLNCSPLLRRLQEQPLS
jgi:4-diphosphocytidyl-2-C-methyl-D-erythritol kinase